MAYTKTSWVDGSAPAISASNLNKIENGIYDSLRQDGTTAMSGQLVVVSGSATTPSISASGDSNTGVFFPTSDNVALAVGGGEGFRLLANGNVGLSQTNPSVRLSMGTTTGQKFNLYDNPGSTIGIGMGIDISGIGSYETTFYTKSSAGGNGQWVFGHLDSSNTFTEKMRLNNNGYLLIGYTSSNGSYPLQVNGQIFATSATIATSDRNYKENIKPLMDALSIVNALNPVSFDWKEHPVHNFDRTQSTIGFIAQEVAEVLKDQPYLDSVVKKSVCEWETETGETVEREVTREVTREITEEVDGEEVIKTITEEVTEVVTEAVKEKHTEEFYGIAESNLIAILTKAVQELSDKVKFLESKIK